MVQTTNTTVEEKLEEVKLSREKVRQLFSEISREIKKVKDNVPDYSPYRREHQAWKAHSDRR